MELNFILCLEIYGIEENGNLEKWFFKRFQEFNFLVNIL